ncbi:hypothetical protein Elgi_58660 [Paenibacillus elgii]|uniref:hypothetical protein n=1 Tax=Paenibacillus elgii TaxID=189691 RepID=UPI002D7C6BF8|nr:hypothetical protein Elgi_58660 [Paenibacillus elgii]
MNIQHGEASPTKKVYTLTDSGLRELHRLSPGYPEIPEIRKTFLMQLEQYSSEVKGFMLAMKRIGDTRFGYGNIRQSYESELAWIEKLRMKVVSGLIKEKNVFMPLRIWNRRKAG